MGDKIKTERQARELSKVEPERRQEVAANTADAREVWRITSGRITGGPLRRRRIMQESVASGGAVDGPDSRG